MSLRASDSFRTSNNLIVDQLLGEILSSLLAEAYRLSILYQENHRRPTSNASISVPQPGQQPSENGEALLICYYVLVVN